MSDMVMTCRGSGGQILFAGLDDVDKLKSITPETGVLTDVWVEEATEVNYRSYKQLTKRLRGTVEAQEGSNAPGGGEKRLILSFNPASREHWIWREFFVDFDDAKGFLEDDDRLIVRTTYRDNRFLTEGDRKALLGEKDAWYYAIYTDGRWAAPEGTVYHNWRVEDFSQIEKEFDDVRWGLDFGFAADPNALIGCYVDTRRKRIYIFHEFVKSGLHDDELAQEVMERVGRDAVVCDCAEPKAISDLCRRGVRAVPAVKGPDSVRYGIRFLQGFEIVVSPRCSGVAGELAAYRWQLDKNGGVLPRPEDKNNHLLDALRYAVEDLMLQGRARAVKRI